MTVIDDTKLYPLKRNKTEKNCYFSVPEFVSFRSLNSDILKACNFQFLSKVLFVVHLNV